MSYVRYSFVIDYVNEHQLPHTVDTSHTTPTTRVNRGPMLSKLIKRDIFYVLSGSRTYTGLACPASQKTWKRSRDKSRRRIYARKISHV